MTARNSSLSDAQRQAVESFGRNVSVFAGAGSGKTSVLVERFLYAVTRRGADPERILAITFTEKATNEMKKRLVEQSVVRGLGKLRRRLENAPVGTIHGFCSKLLRENPVEAGVDPFFQILTEGESEILVTRTLERLFEEEAENALWLRMLGDYGETTVMTALRNFYDRGRSKGLADEALFLPGGLPTEGESGELGARYKKEFERMYRRFKERYESEKRKIACYDFEDLLMLAWRLLSGASPEKQAVRRRIQEFFSFILLDECQDTSPVQAHIVRLLSRGENLFVVGDPQQSIYGFRHADPRVFTSLAAGPAQRVSLTRNYRSRPPILEFVNKLFARTESGGHFEPLEPARIFLSEKAVAVEVLPVPKEAGGKRRSLDATRVVEARTLAAKIRELIGSPLQVEEKGRSRPLEYRDIAVLFKRMGSSVLFEKELSEAGIPYFSLKGRGFHEKHEIRDLLNFLSLIENVDSDIALAGVLRSPLFGVSDDGLFWLARFAKAGDSDAPLASALESPEKIQGLSAEDRQRVIDFKRLWQELRSRKDRLSLSEILETVMERTHDEAKVLTLEAGRQKAANLRRLAETAMRFEARKLVGIRDFVDYFENLPDRESSGAEISIESESGNSVTLSTVHAAKGLEFPLVILADMGGKTKKNRTSPFETLETVGFGVQLKNPRTQKLEPDATYAAVRSAVEGEERAEDNRLLYVAMTRAKEHLILSGAVGRAPSKPGKKTETWMDRLVRLLGIPPEGAQGELLDFEGIAVRVLKPQEGSSPVEKRPSLEPPVFGDGPEDTAFLESMKSRIHFPRRKYDRVKDATVSDLLEDWLKEEASAEHRVPGSLETIKEEAPSEDEIATPRNEYGTLFHKAMERLVSQRPAKISRAFLAGFTRHFNAAEKEEMTQSLGAFWKSDWGQRIRKSKRLYPELPFIYKTRYGVLKGQIDLVFEGPKGEWVVLDYKTNRVTAEEVKPLAGAYEFQLSLYALVFTRLYGKPVRRGALYFASPGKTHEVLYDREDYRRFEERLDRCYRRFAGLSSEDQTA